jgi:hypothetical protein
MLFNINCSGRHVRREHGRFRRHSDPITLGWASRLHPIRTKVPPSATPDSNNSQAWVRRNANMRHDAIEDEILRIAIFNDPVKPLATEKAIQASIQ